HHFYRISSPELNLRPAREQNGGQSERATASGANASGFAPSGDCTNPSSWYGRADDGSHVLALAAISLNRSFLVFDACGVWVPGCSLYRARQQQDVAVGEDHGGKAHLQFGAALDLAGTLYPPDFSLNEGTGWNDNPVIHHNGKCSLRVNGIARAGVLGGKALLHGERNSRARGNGDRVGGGGRAVLLGHRNRARCELRRTIPVLREGNGWGAEK